MDTTFDETVKSDLSALNEMSEMLARGVSRECLLNRFRDDPPFHGIPIAGYLEEMEAEGLIEESSGIVKYRAESKAA